MLGRGAPETSAVGAGETAETSDVGAGGPGDFRCCPLRVARAPLRMNE